MPFIIRKPIPLLLIVCLLPVFVAMARAAEVKEPELVRIPAGSFTMGTPSWAGKPSFSYEAEPHEVTIGYEFRTGKYEVTREEWGACVEAGACPKPSVRAPLEGRFPVTGVSFEDVAVYLKWLSAETGKKYRLLTEAEWEYVARGGATGIYATERYLKPWQTNFRSICEKTRGFHERCLEAQGNDELERPFDLVEAGSFEANGFGLHDVHGNAYEWTADCVNESYAGAPTDGSAWMQGDCTQRIIRGGSFQHTVLGQRLDQRMSTKSNNRTAIMGFRVAVSD